jgi:hypothetical protein
MKLEAASARNLSARRKYHCTNCLELKVEMQDEMQEKKRKIGAKMPEKQRAKTNRLFVHPILYFFVLR